MGKFESPCQIAGLFVGAALVAIGVIFVLNIEATKRYGEPGEKQEIVKPLSPEEGRSAGFLHQLKVKIRNLITGNSVEEGGIKRRKRSVDEVDFINDPEDDIDDDFDDNEVNDKKATEISENLLTESLNSHKLRNVAQKVALLDPETDQITAEILRQFCPKPVIVNLTEEVIYADQDNDKKSSPDHKFPPINTKNGDLDRPNSTLLSFKVAPDDSPREVPVFACESYGNLLYTVILTTVVNFSFVALLICCRSSVQNFGGKSDLDCTCGTSNNLHQEVFYPEDFVMDSDDSPIVKEHYLPSNVCVY